MGSLACALRPSGLTLGRLPYSFPPSPGDVVPMVPNLVSSPRVLGKRAMILNQLDLLASVNLSSAPSDME
jgi:hypothetical protein